jgi:CDP-diacylglycerol--glycerol-3-phosphate 3-phosphatidyltransferase
MNLPNKLTTARCVMAGIFVALMSFEHPVWYFLAYVVFTAAAITDYYDGKIAREQNLITNFGKLLDPVADKVLMLAAFLMMMKIPALHVPGWTIVVILTREFMVTGARALAASEGTVIAAIASGKTKTVLQMVYVFVFLFFAFIFQLWDTYPVTGSWLPGDVAIYKRVIGMASMASITLVAAYTVYSGVEFARINWRKLGLDNI